MLIYYIAYQSILHFARDNLGYKSDNQIENSRQVLEAKTFIQEMLHFFTQSASILIAKGKDPVLM